MIENRRVEIRRCVDRRQMMRDQVLRDRPPNVIAKMRFKWSGEYLGPSQRLHREKEQPGDEKHLERHEE